MLLIGFGHRARQGKNTAAIAMLNAAPVESRARIYAYADALRAEVRYVLADAQDPYWEYLTETRHRAIKRFLHRVRITESCWQWAGKTNEKGYGVVYTEERANFRAHRFMWEIVLGNAPAPLLRHTCDNPPCVNPLHLLPGTPKDNSRDMVERGRAVGHITIPAGVVAQARQMFAEGCKQSDIVRTLALSSGTVSRYVNGISRAAVDIVSPKTALTWLESKRVLRPMLQHYGTDYRRAQDPDYWVKRLMETLEREQPDMAFVTDVRFPNEVEAIHAAGGYVVKVVRSIKPDIAVPAHPSENALDGYTGWDYTLTAATLPELRTKAAALYPKIAGKQ